MKKLFILILKITTCAIAMDSDLLLDFTGVDFNESDLSPQTVVWAEQYVQAEVQEKEKMQKEVDQDLKEIQDKQKIIKRSTDLLIPRLTASLVIQHPDIQRIMFGSAYRSASCICEQQKCTLEFKETIEAVCSKNAITRRYIIWDSEGNQIAQLKDHYSKTPQECFVKNGNEWEKTLEKQKIIQRGRVKTTFHFMRNGFYLKQGTILANVRGYDDYRSQIYHYHDSWQTYHEEVKTEQCLSPVQLFAVSSDRKYIVGGSETQLKLWAINSISHDNRFSLIKGLKTAKSVTALSFGPDNKTLATALQNKVYLWKVNLAFRSLKVLACLTGHKGKINSLAFDEKGARLASASKEDGTAHIWDLKQLKTDD